MSQPTCPTHNVPMAPRPVYLQTAEQKWCGAWHDCPKCKNSILVPSAALSLIYQPKAATTAA